MFPNSLTTIVNLFICDFALIFLSRRTKSNAGSLAYAGPDISVPTHRFKDRTTRITDPNNPTYHINGTDYFDDKYTKPSVGRAYIADNHLLQTKDIAGATPGWVDVKFERREVRNINFIQDIEGAQADSIKHSIVTNRQSNPLEPVYQSLDPGELLQPLIPPLIPPSMVKVPTVPIQRGNKAAAATPAHPEHSRVPSKPTSPQYEGECVVLFCFVNFISYVHCFFFFLLIQFAATLNIFTACGGNLCVLFHVLRVANRLRHW